jgi:hypothetical protein
MPKVYVSSLRSLARKVQPSILTGAITEAATYIEELEKTNKELRDFIEDLYTSWDCDADAHKHNTLCRACEAKKIIEGVENVWTKKENG